MDTSETYRNKEFLVREYIVGHKSVKQIRREYGWGINTIKRWLNYHNIPIRGHADPIVICQKTGALNKNPRWQGWRKNNGYIYIYSPEHPDAGYEGYVSESRAIASQVLGRPLKRQEIIHHIDGDTTNNNKANLYVTNRSEHRRIHASLTKGKE
jgi:hypothetical protein